MTIDLETVSSRRRNLKRWIDTHFAGNQSAFLADIAARTGKPANQGELSGLLGSKSFGEKKARKLEAQAGMPVLYLDSSSVSPSDATGAYPSNPRLRRIRIEGAVKMNEHGIWEQGDRDAEETSFPTDDADAYAIRILSHVFQPVIACGQCIIVSPNAGLMQGRHALVILMDGRRTLRTFQSHERGVWTFTKVTDGNAFTTLDEGEVSGVQRVMGAIWTE